jgi:hypothetical protein
MVTDVPPTVGPEEGVTFEIVGFVEPVEKFIGVPA